ncbi:threonine/serine dehydratase [Pseudomonas sp. JG-B]|uniref:threonine ammonia-lyase n=1 Tax=Pseudomonas sp. JG-B TaxID=2603214 RepID=UPI00129D61E6|nr:threonine/serine dehydratase [Pseudomonas sp. JG-B]MRK21938.1 threonine/serine dehydratase [Pseudomonas sp. JG-B]
MPSFNLLDIQDAAARLSGHIVRTPILESPQLNAAAGCRVIVKAESLQRTGAFKLRGALNLMLSLGVETLKRGVVTYSAGNHGQGVAAGARMLGCPAVVVMPLTAPAIKQENCRWWGADVVLYDPETEDREHVVGHLVRSRGLTFIPPFDNLQVMAGQGTLGLEFCKQLTEVGITPDALLVGCSGGGLASGVITAFQELHPRARCYIVEPSGYEKMARSLVSGDPETNTTVGTTIQDALSGPTAGARPLEVLREHRPGCLNVRDDEALAGIAAAFRWLKLVVEPGGAAALGAVLAQKSNFYGKTVAVVCSGGNLDPGVFAAAITRTA